MNRTNSQPSGRRGYYSRYLKHYTKKYYGLLALGALFAVGLTLGTLLVRTVDSDTLSLLLRMVNGFVENRREQSLFQNFLSGMTSALLFLAILFVCGFCAISQPVIVLLPLFRGLGTGFSMASLYAAHGAGAMGYVLLLMLPGTLVTTLVILVCCRESLRMSWGLLSLLGGGGGNRDRREGGGGYSVRLYLARYFACAAGCVLIAFVEAVLYFGFANFFVLG